MRRIFVPLLGLVIVTELVITLAILPRFEWNESIVIIFTIVTGAVGVLLVARLRGHLIGWLLLLASAAAATGALAVTYVEADVASPLPASFWMMWVGELAFLVMVAILSTFLLLLFPTGRPASPRWRVVIGLAAIGALMMGVGVIFSPESFESLPISNPIALPKDHVLLVLVEGVGLSLLSFTIVASFASLFWRYRLGSALERQQLKWAVFGMAVASFGLLGPAVWELVNGMTEIPADVENFLVMLGLTFVPVTIGLAILRFRLYEIDRIISRTISYAAIVGLLGAVFAAGVVLIPNAVPGLEDSGPLVAVSTLGVAALFNPLRRRVQEVVDRRFNRSRYDVERVMEGFVGSLRNRTNPEGLVVGWVGVVSDTMQPSAVGVWTR